MGEVATAGGFWGIITIMLPLLLGMLGAYTMVRNRQRARAREEQSARRIQNSKLIAARIDGDRVAGLAR